MLSCGEHDPTSVFWGPVRRGVLSVVLCVVATLVVDGGMVETFHYGGAPVIPVT